MLAGCPGRMVCGVARVSGVAAVWPEVAVALPKVLGPSSRGRRPAGKT